MEETCVSRPMRWLGENVSDGRAGQGARFEDLGTLRRGAPVGPPRFGSTRPVRLRRRGTDGLSPLPSIPCRAGPLIRPDTQLGREEDCVA
jgi:hypothetical protein